MQYVCGGSNDADICWTWLICRKRAVIIIHQHSKSASNPSNLTRFTNNRSTYYVFRTLKPLLLSHCVVNFLKIKWKEKSSLCDVCGFKERNEDLIWSMLFNLMTIVKRLLFFSRFEYLNEIIHSLLSTIKQTPTPHRPSVWMRIIQVHRVPSIHFTAFSLWNYVNEQNAENQRTKHTMMIAKQFTLKKSQIGGPFIKCISLSLSYFFT